MAKWKDILATVAPSIGNALGGPLGGLAVSTALEALGVEADGGEKALKAKLADLSPADYVKLKEADLNYQQRLAELEVEETKLHLADRQDARSMYEKLQGPANRLAIVVVGGFFLTIGSLFWFGGKIDPALKEPLMLLIGVLGGAFTSVVAFFFGTSRGSKEKAQTIDSLKRSGQ